MWCALIGVVTPIMTFDPTIVSRALIASIVSIESIESEVSGFSLQQPAVAMTLPGDLYL